MKRILWLPLATILLSSWGSAGSIFAPLSNGTVGYLRNAHYVAQATEIVHAYYPGIDLGSFGSPFVEKRMNFGKLVTKKRILVYWNRFKGKKPEIGDNPVSREVVSVEMTGIGDVIDHYYAEEEFVWVNWMGSKKPQNEAQQSVADDP